MKKKILCTICIRSGSKGFKNKNIRKINRKPLVLYSYEVAKKTKILKKFLFRVTQNFFKHM